MRAALYLRSSKDRHDVSISAQRRDLEELASRRNEVIAAEFADVVQSGKDEHRPEFQRLIRALKDRQRGWSTLLILDTSRLARNRLIAQAFAAECKRRGVTIAYAKLPDMDPITQVIVESVFQAMDEVHSLMSREKGLSGMAENVRNGYRAGGRAPLGYTLVKHETGAVREGAAVTKSTLEPDPTIAPRLAAYLSARATGVARITASKDHGLADKAKTSLIGIEWNALTYAGCLVWNVHNETMPGGGYKDGKKRRPRSEWHINEDAHPALITRAEAEAILAALESSKIGKAKTTGSDYLMSGLLQTPEGVKYYPSRGKYQAKGGGSHSIEEIDAAVVAEVRAQINNPDFLSALVTAAKEAWREDVPSNDARAGLTEKLRELDTRIEKQLSLAEQLVDPAPAMRMIDKIEVERKEIVASLSELDKEHDRRRILAKIDAETVQNSINAMDASDTKALIRRIVDGVVIDPKKKTLQIRYRVAVDDGHLQEMVASPRRRDLFLYFTGLKIAA